MESQEKRKSSGFRGVNFPRVSHEKPKPSAFVAALMNPVSKRDPVLLRETQPTKKEIEKLDSCI